MSTSNRAPGARSPLRHALLLVLGVLLLVLPATVAVAANDSGNGQGADHSASASSNSQQDNSQQDKDNSHCDDEESGPGHKDCKPDNNPHPEDPPCDADHGHPGDHAKPCQDDGTARRRHLQ